VPVEAHDAAATSRVTAYRNRVLVP